ncbi:MAG: Fe(3+) ABC transporter substrate-binding protein [Gammaproteobacteria bacterium]|nr:Fe(3+) ABC transporter substrate-binding protein [Gammaproteobacteria bacterium]MDH3465880.1 Fe(3+) ABC transporter substrate-binding protein [Gammaproteobacteria bacterium]
MIRQSFNGLFMVAAAIALLNMQPAIAAEVNVYSARKEALIKPLLDRFSADTGIRVNLVTGKADALLARLLSEGVNSPADVLITTDAGRLHRAKTADVLQAVDSTVLAAAVPAEFTDSDGYWFGLSMRARPVMYAKDRVDPTTLNDYEDLASPEWKARICVRSSDNIYNQSMVASMLIARGVESTEEWAEALVANLARDPKGGDRDQIKAVAAGQCDVAIANTYYLAHLLNSDDSNERRAAQAVAIHWPNQSGRGTHVNVSGIAMTRAAPNPDQALQLMEYLVGDAAQTWYAESNYEYPVKLGLGLSPTVAAWGKFKADSVSLSRLGEFNSRAVMLMDRAGWR